MLEAAGLPSTSSRRVSTRRVKRAICCGTGLDAADVAEALARAKAEAVSARAPDALVIGADQVLALGEEIVRKPDSMERRAAELLDLRGKVAQAASAVALATWRDRVGACGTRP